MMGLNKDYCSFSPDFNFGNTCCKTHDESYSKGSVVPRAIADMHLRVCIKNKGWPKLSWIYWGAVRSIGWMFYKGGG